jgi:hypothetical protein
MASGLWPSSQRGGECLLYRFLGERKIAKEASEHCHSPAVFAPKDRRNFCAQARCSMNGRTSIGVVVARASS